MKTRLTLGLTLTGAVILAGCAPDQPSSRLLPTQASLSVVPGACSFPATYAAANAYFAQTSDPVYQLVITMEHAHINGGATGATSAGFDVLGRLGVAADLGTPIKGTPAQGSAFANAVLSCMSVSGYHAAIDFALLRDKRRSPRIAASQLIERGVGAVGQVVGAADREDALDERVCHPRHVGFAAHRLLLREEHDGGNARLGA